MLVVYSMVETVEMAITLTALFSESDRMVADPMSDQPNSM